MRGTHVSRLRYADIERFIPAYAGNAVLERAQVSRFSVHPRVCGERHRATGMMNDNAGSSPRMRGTHMANEQDRSETRFIPAYAGNALENR